ncbi:MAG: hypothetical protein RIR26_1274 [Pseudomonadota bacterium]
MTGLQSCSTVDEATGRCKAFKDAKYVASVTDTDGKPWQLKVTPESLDVKCDYQSDKGDPPTSGILVFTAVVTDGQGMAKPALSIKGRFSGISPNGANETQPGFYQNPLPDVPDDVATDSCGVAVFRLKWVCPSPKKTAAGSFYVESGPLISKPVQVTLEHKVQMEQQTTTTTPTK